MDIMPIHLSEAILTLYPADVNGDPIRESPVFIGSLATGLNLRKAFEEELSFASGDAYKTARHTDEIHVIEIERNWFVQKTNMADDANPQRASYYVMEIVWSTQDELDQWYWKSRVYYGVTARSMDLISQGTRHFSSPQIFRAQRYTANGGGLTPDIYTPTPPLPSEIQDVLFVKENPLMPLDYFLGHYRWSALRTALSARVIALAPQDTPVELTLEVNGTLTGVKLNLATGPANTQVSDQVSFSIPILAGQSVRWKVTSAAPDPSIAAWQAAIVMEVQ